MDYFFKNTGEFFQEITHPEPLPFYGRYSIKEFHCIERGYSPKTREDPWHISFEGNTVYFHRTWTGECIYQIELVKQGKMYWICAAFVSRHPKENHWTDEAYDCKLLDYLIDQFLLGKPTHFPDPFD